MFRKMPFILLAIIVCVSWLSPWIPPSTQSVLYGISLSIKSFIVFVLPFVVFGLLFKTAVNFAGKASKMILWLLAVICCSNFLSTLMSYSVGTLAYRFDLSLNFPNEGIALLPAFEFSFPSWIGNSQAMFSGLALGVILGILKPVWSKAISLKLEKVINILLRGVLVAIPFFIVGFVIKMQHDQLLTYIFRNYSLIFFLVASATYTYIAFIYFIVNGFQGRAAINSLKNMLPAAIAGFGSMSSAAAMPLTILGAEKNAKNPDLARSIIPATVNIHLMGDCFAIPIFAFAVLKSFGVSEPSLFSYLIFASYFVLAKFSVAAVPGGGILVMLPILETYLGFNVEMLSLITALYILFDPVITCANILGNGGFTMGMENLAKALPAGGAFDQKAMRAELENAL